MPSASRRLAHRHYGHYYRRGICTHDADTTTSPALPLAFHITHDQTDRDGLRLQPAYHEPFFEAHVSNYHARPTIFIRRASPKPYRIHTVTHRIVAICRRVFITLRPVLFIEWPL